MQFRIADTFTGSLAKLPNDQQRAAKTTAFDLQTNIAHPGLSLHRVTGVRDPGFWSARVNLDLRLILHRSGEDVVLCYVDSHDDAYCWAERRRLETHPTTGAAQMVELREVVQEVVVPVYVEEERTAPPKSFLFARITDEQLLGYGVPEEWIDGVRVATEDSVLDLADHLPAEAAEALLELAVGGTPQPSLLVPADGDPFSHPDALRRFRVMKTSRNWRRPSNTRGIGGPYSCTRTSEGLSTGTTTGLPGYPARQAPARLSSPCTGPPTWPGPTLTPECC